MKEAVKILLYVLCTSALMLCVTPFNVHASSKSPSLVKSNKSTINTPVIESYSTASGIKIDVVLPPSYQEHAKAYPVIYVLDSERYLLLPWTYQSTLSWKEYSPEFITVGINIDKRARRAFFGKDAPALINTLQDEVIPFIGNSYRSNSLKLLFGWEKGAGFAIEFMTSNPMLFDALLLASGTFFTASRIENLRKVLANNKKLNTFVYSTLSDKEPWALPEHKVLASVFNEYTITSFQAAHFSGENHYSTPLTTLNNGLSLFFKTYAPLRFYSIKEYQDFGGIFALKQHYIERGNKYEVTPQVHKQTIHFLLNQAVKEKNYLVFNQVLSEFPGFIENNGYRAVFFDKFAKFHAENKSLNKAKQLYLAGIIAHPNTFQLHENLADLQIQTNEPDKALEHYQFAQELLSQNKVQQGALEKLTEKINRLTEGLGKGEYNNKK